jgi:hypothetical protein
MKQILRLSLATIFWAALAARVPVWKDGGTVLPVAYAQAVTIKFAPPTNYPVGVAPFNVATGDFNGDGKQDLAVANSGNGTVSILLGNGDGTFQQAMDFTVGSPLNRVAVGDFNGDGKPDLAVGNGSANAVSILLGKGDGTFELPVRHNTGISADYIAVADFNNDKKSDLLVSATPIGPLYQGSISILLGNGDGAFDSPKVTSVTSFQGIAPLVAIGDFNGDGRLDVATGNATVNYSGTKGNVIILPGNGDGTFQAPVTSPTSFQPIYLTTGDFNGDGKADLAVVARFFWINQLHQLGTFEAVAALLGNGDGTFRVSATEILPYHYSFYPPPPQNPYAPNVAVADLNHDGKLDVVLPVVVPNPSIVGGQTTGIWAFLGNGDGTFEAAQKFNLATAPSWLAVGEFNRDTLPDLALSNYSVNDISVLLNTTPH